MVVRGDVKPYYDQALAFAENNPLPLMLHLLSQDLRSHSSEKAALRTEMEVLRQLVETKDETIASERETIAAKDVTINLMQSKIIELEVDLLKGEAKSRAASGSRIVLEAGICRYRDATAGCGSSFTSQFEHFYKARLLEPSMNLSAESKRFLVALAPFGLIVQEVDVIRELKALVHNLSKAHHYLIPGSTPGVHIGGELATTTALAICMLCLQTHRFSDLDLVVTGPNGVEKCLLSAGAVGPMPAVAAVSR
jgi:hypothetical protein